MFRVYAADDRLETWTAEGEPMPNYLGSYAQAKTKSMERRDTVFRVRNETLPAWLVAFKAGEIFVVPAEAMRDKQVGAELW